LWGAGGREGSRCRKLGAGTMTFFKGIVNGGRPKPNRLKKYEKGNCEGPTEKEKAEREGVAVTQKRRGDYKMKSQPGNETTIRNMFSGRAMGEKEQTGSSGSVSRMTRSPLPAGGPSPGTMGDE